MVSAQLSLSKCQKKNNRVTFKIGSSPSLCGLCEFLNKKPSICNCCNSFTKVGCQTNVIFKDGGTRPFFIEHHFLSPGIFSTAEADLKIPKNKPLSVPPWTLPTKAHRSSDGSYHLRCSCHLHLHLFAFQNYICLLSKMSLSSLVTY